MIINNFNLNAIGVILLSYFSLRVFYRVFQLKWPELYFSTQDKTALAVSVSWKRYATFRFLPVFVSISLYAGIFLKNFSLLEYIYISVASSIFYGIMTDGLAIIRVLTKSKNIKTYFNSWHQILLHLVTITLLVFVGIISGIAANTTFVSSITPTPQGLVDNIWSSLIVVILAFYFKDVLSGEGPAENIIFKKSLEGIDPQILHAIDKYSKEEYANTTLVKAICIAENLQRPPWIRKVEYFTKFIRHEGTYGIMQVKSKNPITDLESVKIATTNYFKNSHGIKNELRVKELIRKYNDDNNYVDIVIKIMYFLDYSSIENNYE